jgi:hypothetical protein
MADDADSKSVARKGVWVQVPLSAGRIPVVVPRGGEQPVFFLLARSFAQHAGGGCGSVDGAELPAYTYGEHGNTQRRWTMHKKKIGMVCAAALMAALLATGCGKKSSSKVVETSAENRAAETAASVAASSGSAESSTAAGSQAAEKRALISAKTESYQKDNISIGYPVVSGLTDSAQQEKLNTHLKENALSPIEALLTDPTKDKLTVTAEVISADADRVVVTYRGEMQRSGDTAPVQLFYSNTVAVRSLKDLGLRDAVDADSMANYALSDAFELANAGESEVNAYKAWIQANGKDALQKSIAEKLEASDFPLKKGEDGKLKWPESFSYVKNGEIYFSLSLPAEYGSVVVFKYDMVTK